MTEEVKSVQGILSKTPAEHQSLTQQAETEEPQRLKLDSSALLNTPYINPEGLESKKNGLQNQTNGRFDPQLYNPIQQICRGVKFKPKFVMIGLGRLQLGAMGSAFSELEYQLIGVNLGSKEAVQKLAAHKGYWVIDKLPFSGTFIEVEAAYHYDPAHPDSPEIQAAVMAAADADIINSGLGVQEQATEASASFLLAVMRYRIANAIFSPLVVMSSDNPVGTSFGIEFLQKKLQSATYNLDAKERRAVWNHIADRVRFLPALVDRICSKREIPLDAIKPLYVVVEEYAEITFPKAFLTTQPLAFKNAESLGKIKICDNLEIARQRKIYLLSMAHAMASYLGFFQQSKPRTVSEALKLKTVRSHVERALEEAATTLATVTGESKVDWLKQASTVLERISDERLNDSISRVARDVGRKLHKSDRLVGPLLLMLRENFQFSESLYCTILHALLYAYSTPSEQLHNVLRGQGVAAVLTKVCGLDSTDPLEKELINRIEAEFNALCGEYARLNHDVNLSLLAI